MPATSASTGEMNGIGPSTNATRALATVTKQ